LVLNLTVTIQFSFSESIPDALPFIVLWRGSEQGVVAQGLVQASPYGGRLSCEAGTTITLSGNSSRPAEQNIVLTRDLPMAWRFE
jgi:hypothetical protein